MSTVDVYKRQRGKRPRNWLTFGKNWTAMPKFLITGEKMKPQLLYGSSSRQEHTR